MQRCQFEKSDIDRADEADKADTVHVEPISFVRNSELRRYASFSNVTLPRILNDDDLILFKLMIERTI
jgi:hypothetical protein